MVQKRFLPLARVLGLRRRGERRGAYARDRRHRERAKLHDEDKRRSPDPLLRLQPDAEHGFRSVCGDSQRRFPLYPEPAERMVIYQALYGDRHYWVRPEKMFFENIERDGRRFARFTEIDKSLLTDQSE